MILRPDVYAARLGDDVVLLDAGRGEYLCLADAAAAFDLSAVGPPRILDPELAADAAQMGLLGEGRALASRELSLAALDIADRLPISLDSKTLAHVLATFGELLGRYYGRSFPELLRYVVSRRRLDAPALTPGLAEQVQAFRTILPWAPFQGVCLYRSFFLLAFLRRRGLDASWVFGVRTWPFEAHCWLQVGDVVLDDSFDHVRPFTPILAV